ncbi:MAG: hypothetical protein SFT68_02140 [Rickettsiaceae bacterium]|nr:hypothetical protein [Rickettsiaceae bacterium]
MLNAIRASYGKFIDRGIKPNEILGTSDSFSSEQKNPEIQDDIDIGSTLIEESFKATKEEFLSAVQRNADMLDAIQRTHQQLTSTYLETMANMQSLAHAVNRQQNNEVKSSDLITFGELKLASTDVAAQTGVEFMNSTLNSVKQFTASNAIYNAVPSKSAALTTISNNVTQRTGALTVAAQPNAGDTITFGTGIDAVKFTFVYSDPNSSKNELVKGADTSGTALNMLKAFQSCTANEMKKYSFSVSGQVLKITKLAVSSDILNTSNFSSSSTGARITQAYTATASTAFHTASYTGYELLGAMGTFTVASVSVGNTVYQTAQTYANASGLTTIPTMGANANAADVLVKFNFTIGSTAYNGYLLNNNNGAEAHVDDRIYCLKTSDDISGNNLYGKVFSIKLQDSQKLSSCAEIGSIISFLNWDAALITFSQARYMTVNTDNLTHEYQGMSAIYSSTDFTNLSIDNVSCTSTSLTVNLLDSSDTIHAYTDSLPLTPIIAGGTAITLTEYNTNHTITLMFPSIIDLTTPRNRADFADALGTALGAKSNSGS